MLLPPIGNRRYGSEIRRSMIGATLKTVVAPTIGRRLQGRINNTHLRAILPDCFRYIELL